jgi:glycosyltransferase involved in cell wall biosynthesis
LHFPQFFKPNSFVRRELLYRFACQSASHIVVASEFVGDDLRDRYTTSPDRITVIPWGAATSALPEPSLNDVQGVRSKYRLPPRFAFYPAIAWHHKNHANLLQAIAVLAKQNISVPLVLTGGNTPLVGDLRRLSRKLDIDDSITFIGTVPSSDIRAMYRAAAIVVVPTLFEAVSGPIAEAWLDSVPVVCSDILQLKCQAGDAALFFDPHNPESIAAAIRRVWQESADSAILIKKGKAQIAKLAWDETARRYRDVYRRVARESSILATELPKTLVL